MTRRFAFILLVLLVGSPSAEGADAPPWSEVRALLEARCLSCHGGDDVESGLRFATSETFVRGGDRGSVIDASDLPSSRLIDVISYRDPNLAMPPTGQLPQDEAELLERWVLAGAPWPEGEEGQLADPGVLHDDEIDAVSLDWWSYEHDLTAPVPIVSDRAWSEHAIDAFLYADMTTAGLTPSPSATAQTLLRRATFDLTGLPPSRADIAWFDAERARSGDDAAWNALIERLLARDAYGEHWARHWLDLVRYGETNGYERDATKMNVWRYRDWVVRALNDDLPYDRFLVEQLAGDELAEWAPELITPGRENEALLATGYYRLGVWDDEPADRAQASADELADIVDTTGQVFLGAMVGCARCHDHKADPISQRDYYAFTAAFNNVRGYAGDEFGGHLGGGATELVADRSRPGTLKRAERDALVAELEDALDAEASAWTGEVELPTEPRVLVDDARGAGAVWRYATSDVTAGWSSPGFDDAAWSEGRSGFGQEETPGAFVGTAWHGEMIALRTTFALDAVPEALVLSLHHDEDVEVFLNGVLVLQRSGYRVDYTEVLLDRPALDALVVGRNVLAVRCRQTAGGQFIDVGLRTGFDETATVATVEDPRALRRSLLELELKEAPAGLDVPHVRSLFEERERLLAAPLSEAYPAQVAKERGADAPDQFVLGRGSVHAPGDEVVAAIPRAMRLDPQADGALAVAPLPDATSTGRRLALARWMVEDGRSITARVMANRLWQFHFGRGLCRSPGDFGRLGETPTHPELLDHLAQRLIDHGWSLKAMHRELMSTRAYRMSSVGSDAARRLDPRNNLLSHFDPRRLTAEEYRDAVLAVAGTLTDVVGGPSVYPPMPEEVLATASRPDAAWGTSTPEDATRRSVYVFVKRSLRPPLLASFDQPDPDLPCAARFPTNVPTQALITLNGDFTHGAARDFAARLIDGAETLEQRIARAIAHAFARDIEDDELERHVAFVRALITEDGLDERGALELYCLSVFNLNEFLWVD